MKNNMIQVKGFRKLMVEKFFNENNNQEVTIADIRNYFKGYCLDKKVEYAIVSEIVDKIPLEGLKLVSSWD